MDMDTDMDMDMDINIDYFVVAAAAEFTFSCCRVCPFCPFCLSSLTSCSFWSMRKRIERKFQEDRAKIHRRRDHQDPSYLICSKGLCHIDQQCLNIHHMVPFP